MKLPNTRNLNSKNPNGQYVWLRTQIGSMLKNEVYIGNVVNGKKEQVSPKVKKGKMKAKPDYIVVKNMHEPIIDKELWNKVQEKLNSYYTDNRKKYEYPLKDLVYCAECGNKARFQHCKSKTESSKNDWEGNYAVCGKRADYISLCDNGVIGEKLLMNVAKNVIVTEIEKIEYTSKELKEIYKKAKGMVGTVQNELDYKNKELNKVIDEISRLYEKKVSKQITIDEFKVIYQKLNDKKVKLQKEIKTFSEKHQNNDEELKKQKSEYKQMEKIAKEFLKMENPNNEVLKKLVKRMEFDKNKNITIMLTFSKKI